MCVNKIPISKYMNDVNYLLDGFEKQCSHILFKKELLEIKMNKSFLSLFDTAF